MKITVSNSKQRKYFNHINTYRYDERAIFHLLYWLETFVPILCIIPSVYIAIKAYIDNINMHVTIVLLIIFIGLVKFLLHRLSVHITTKDYRLRSDETIDLLDDSLVYTYRDLSSDDRKVLVVTVLFNGINKIEYNKYTGLFTIEDGLMQTVRINGHIVSYDRIPSITMMNKFTVDLIDLFDKQNIFIIEENKKLSH